MTKERIENMTGGWFIGDFLPSVFRTKDVEIAVKHYKAGDRDLKHHHKVAKEISVIACGEATFNGEKFVAGDIVIVDPHESIEFACIKDCIAFVIKIPSVVGDKYLD